MQVKRIDSQDDNVSKYVFDFGNAVAEAVLYKYPTYQDRTVICCSTQSGCPVGCRFCGAGDAFVRSLNAAEIVSQVTHLFADRAIDPASVNKCQIMFMSMGEPMLNYSALAEAIRTLHAMYPRFALLISTSAPRVNYDPLLLLAEEIPTVGLQFSAHESTDAERNTLIPFAAKLTLAEMASIGHLFLDRTGRRPFFNYCAHEKNTAARNADELAAIFDPTVFEATVSVVCERDESVSAANARQRQLATDFMDLLMRRGYSVRCFDPAGQDDIGGGCGQLWFVQDWMRRNAGMVRPSIGATRPSFHAPRP